MKLKFHLKQGGNCHKTRLVYGRELVFGRLDCLRDIISLGLFVFFFVSATGERFCLYVISVLTVCERRFDYVVIVIIKVYYGCIC